jgi:Inositol monophosphatase family
LAVLSLVVCIKISMTVALLWFWCLLEFLFCVRAFVPSSPLASSSRTQSLSPLFSESTAGSTSNTMTLPSTEVLEQVLSVAKDAGKKAGDIILGNAGGAEVVNRKANSRDLLTLIDPLCEKTIKETILATFPDHDFLGEEDVPPGKEASAAAIDEKLNNSKSDWLWIVDPIDGTTNFANGIP